MSAPAINPVVPATPGAGPNPAAAATRSNGAASGFESLMSGMFPQAGAAPSGKGAALAADPAAAGTEQPDAGDGTDAATLLLASGLGAPGAPQPTPVATTPNGQAETTPAAWGRDKTRGAPAAPALLHADPKAGLIDKAQAAEDAVADAAADADPLPTPKGLALGRAEPSAPQGAARTEAAPAPAQPTAPAALTAPDAGDAGSVLPAPVEPTPDANAAATPAADSPTLAAAAEPLPAHTGVQPPRSGRADRKTAAREGDAAERPATPAATGKSGLARAADQAAEPAADKLEAAAAAPRDADAQKGDATDASVPADARAAAQSQAPAASTTHAVRGSPETVANLAAQIVKKLGAKTTRFDVELDPMGLGKVDVRVEIGAQGRLSAAMTFDNPQAAQDVKARAAELQRALEQAGFDLSGGISFDVASDRGQQQQQQQQQAWQMSDDPSGFRGRAFQSALDTASGVAETAMNGALRLRRGITAGLDLRI